MNIFDFDGTIYDGDSCKDIIIYGLRKHFLVVVPSLYRTIKMYKKYKKDLVSFDSVKESLISFIFMIKDTDKFLDEFVKSHIKKIKPWYLDIKNSEDVIITASCDTWINKFASLLDLKYVIATKVDISGKLISKNCKREEKIVRFRELFPNAEVNNSYSDSESDIPMLKLAKNPYVIEGNNVIPYKEGYKFKKKD